MLKERLQSAYAVRDVYLPLKHGAKAFADQVGMCLETMRVERSKPHIKPGAGAEPMATMARAWATALDLEAQIASAHQDLGQMIVDQGLSYHYAYGPDETPNPRESGLRSVA